LKAAGAAPEFSRPIGELRASAALNEPLPRKPFTLVYAFSRRLFLLLARESTKVRLRRFLAAFLHAALIPQDAQ
jgi:hypothetical protein